MSQAARSAAIVFLLPLLASAANAQVVLSPNPTRSAPNFQPYTAEFKITRVQTLADGTAITSEGSEIRARNSAGITMQQDSGENWRLGPLRGTSAGVHDTDGTILVNWSSATKEGHIFKMPPREQRHGCWASASVRMEWEGAAQAAAAPRRPADKIIYNGTNRAIERVPAPVQGSRPQMADLGTIMIQGVQAHGGRVTRTVAVGEAGNDHTFMTVEEHWMAPSLGIMLRESVDDPRVGKRTRELVTLSLDEPDPSLFQPPQDYKVTTEELHPVACPDNP